MELLTYMIPVVGIIALIFALILALRINKQSPGNERMREISSAIHEGAKAFLFAEYKILVFFILALLIAIGFAIQEYCVSLELDGMKLAHYYGYLAGNELLRHWLPGYRSDVCLDLAYSHMLEKWYGCKLHTGEWEGFIRLADYVIAPIELSDPQDDCVLREQICKGK